MLGTIVAAIIGVPTGLFVANRANTAMVVQQQTLGQIQTFETTGGQVDNAVRSVSDALATSKRPDKGLEALRDALGAHASAAFVLRDELGDDYVAYMAKTRDLRGYANNAKTPRDGVVMWQAAIDLITLRKHATERMNKEATR
jgi:hypothetical protein